MSIKTKKSSFITVLQETANSTPHKTAFKFLKSGAVDESITYIELLNEVKQLASFMQQQGYAGKRALIMYSSSITYIKVFLACMFAKVIAIPVYPPTLSNNMDRIRNIMKHSSADIIFTTTTLRSRLNRLLNNTSKDSLTWVSFDEIELPYINDWNVPDINITTETFLQYTSGSTSAPKEVRVTQKNIMGEFGIQPYAIQLIKTESIPKTSSGKIRRNACKQSYETNNLITWYVNSK